MHQSFVTMVLSPPPPICTGNHAGTITFHNLLPYTVGPPMAFAPLLTVINSLWVCLCISTTKQGHSYLYTKTHLRIHLNEKLGLLLSQLWRILHDTSTKRVRRTMLICLNPILLASSPTRNPFEGLAPLTQSEWGLELYLNLFCSF